MACFRKNYTGSVDQRLDGTQMGKNYKESLMTEYVEMMKTSIK